MTRFKTPQGYIEVDGETHNGNPLITIHDEGDAATDTTEVSMMLDN